MKKQKVKSPAMETAVETETAQTTETKVKAAKPVKEKKKGKIETMLELVQTGAEYTADALSQASGASVATVKIQLSYWAKKNGKTISTRKDENKVTYYKLVS